MKRNIILAFIAFILLFVISCNNKKIHNISISQSSKFDNNAHKYAVETKFEINNRFGISQHVSIWEDETTYKSDIADLLKMQKAKADSVSIRYK